MCEVPQGHLDHTELIYFGSNSSWLLESFKTASAMEKLKDRLRLVGHTHGKKTKLNDYSSYK